MSTLTAALLGDVTHATSAAPEAEPTIELWPPVAPANADTTVSVTSPRETIDFAGLLADINTFIRRYVVMSADQAVAIALWVAHTYIIAAFDVTPYLNVESATARAGKTRLFEVLALLVFNAWL